MDNQLFRKESLDRISSPEELHDYMRVTSPRLWMILTAIVVLLAGFIVYACTAVLENTLPVRIEVKTTVAQGESADEAQTTVSCILPLERSDVIHTGQTVRFSGIEGRVEAIYTTDQELGVSFDMGEKIRSIGDGVYDGEIVLESVTPVSFLLH